ncbi:flippase-like domain-containing protein [bacterium AH-315-C07]|nr:flippase-like domain-containing protein [bacterium AH-315-C07]
MTKKKSALSVFKDIILLALGILLLYLAFRKQDFSVLLEEFVRVSIAWIVVSKLLALTAQTFRAARWKMLIEPLGYKPRLDNVLYAIMSGYLTNIVTPKLGEVVRCWAVNRTDKAPIAALLGTVIVERALDFIVLFLIMSGVFLFNFQLLSSFLLEHIINPAVDSVSIAGLNKLGLEIGLVLGLFLLLFIFRKAILRSAMTQKILRKLAGVKDGLTSISKLSNMGGFIIYTVLIWVFYVLAFFAGFQAFQSTVELGILDAIFVYVFSALGWAAPIHGSIGAFHWLVAQGLVFKGLTFSNGLVFATVMHAAGILFKLIVGGFSFIMIMLRTNTDPGLPAFKDVMADIKSSKSGQEQ